MKVLVRHFASLRERRGRDEEELELAAGTTAGQLYLSLFPPGPEGTLPVLFAVNREYTRAGHVLADGDEVVFVPPLGGG